MNQCYCSSNKLGIHCYKCEDEELELVSRAPKMCKKKMCKKKVGNKNKGVAK